MACYREQRRYLATNLTTNSHFIKVHLKSKKQIHCTWFLFSFLSIISFFFKFLLLCWSKSIHNFHIKWVHSSKRSRKSFFFAENTFWKISAILDASSLIIINFSQERKRVRKADYEPLVTSCCTRILKHSGQQEVAFH